MSEPDNRTITRERSATDLQARIAANTSGQRVDLAAWILERLDLQDRRRILELCCGTGGQTRRFLKSCPQLEVVGVDISEEALHKLSEALSPRQREAFEPLTGNIDHLPGLLTDAGYEEHSFDLMFCGYGLYYASDPVRVLENSLRWLRDSGSIVVVGPFGPNNWPLFQLLQRAEVEIPDFVTFTSRDFMLEDVVPWGAERFQSTRIHTLVNEVRWQSVSDVLSYWRSSTFFDADRESAVWRLLQEHFESAPEFVNEKHVMMIEMFDARR